MKPFHANQTKQRGAALVVGLVLMMVLTILAISTMRTATLELLMAGNAQYKEKAFQLAETGLQDAMSRIRGTNLALPGTAGTEFSGVITGSIDDSGDDYVVDVRYVGSGQPPDSNSLGQEVLYYELTSTGRTVARGARSVLKKGFWIRPGQQ